MLIGNNAIGTTLVLIATDAFNRYQTATGGVADSATGLLSITSSQYSNLQSLFFNVGDVCILLRVISAETTEYPSSF